VGSVVFEAGFGKASEAHQEIFESRHLWGQQDPWCMNE